MATASITEAGWWPEILNFSVEKTVRRDGAPQEFSTNEMSLIPSAQAQPVSQEAASGKSKEVLDDLRKQSREIDSLDNKHKAVVSVMVLREGWDVQNVTVVVHYEMYDAIPLLSKWLDVIDTSGRGDIILSFDSVELLSVNMPWYVLSLQFIE